MPEADAAQTRARVTNCVTHQAAEFLHGVSIDVPRSGGEWPSFSIPVQGWALPKAHAVESVEVVSDGRMLNKLSEPMIRTDIAENFPDVDRAAEAGFRGWINSLELPREFELLVRVRLDTGRSFPIGSIEGTREPISSSYEPQLNPLLINTVGRSGSTWLAWLLSCHPEITSFGPFEHEPRLATYWMRVLQELANPPSYLAQFDPPDLSPPRWWLGEPSYNPGVLKNQDVATWLGATRLPQIAGHCLEEVDHFYTSEPVEPDPRQRFFVEKMSPWQVEADLLTEVYPAARELILVRDFRDVFCSIRSFTRKRGFRGFGQNPDQTDEEYITGVMPGFANSLLNRWRSRRESTHLVRYEDLIESPSETLTGILRFVGADAGEDVVAEAIRTAASTPSISGRHLTAADPGASIGRWRKDLEPELVRAFEEAVGAQLADFGYPAT